jgi:hypothetical protein
LTQIFIYFGQHGVVGCRCNSTPQLWSDNQPKGLIMNKLIVSLIVSSFSAVAMAASPVAATPATPAVPATPAAQATPATPAKPAAAAASTKTPVAAVAAKPAAAPTAAPAASATKVDDKKVHKTKAAHKEDAKK